MKRYIKLWVTGIGYGFLPVALAWLLVRNLWALAALIGNLAGLDQTLVQQITQALQQLQTAPLVLPWFGAIVLGLAAVGGLYLTRENRKARKALIVAGIVLLLPLTLGAFCLAQVNEIRVWNVLSVLLPMLKAL